MVVGQKPLKLGQKKIISGLKFVSIHINSIRGKKLELFAFLDFHQPQVVAIQETNLFLFIRNFMITYIHTKYIHINQRIRQ